MVSGWHHTVVRGVLANGTNVAYAWGRCDMNQYPYTPLPSPSSPTHTTHNTTTDTTTNTIINSTSYATTTKTTTTTTGIRYHDHPIPLKALPEGEICEIWAGSESTLAVNEVGLLYACGWNEHGKLHMYIIHCSILICVFS